MIERRVLLAGATGLVGRALLRSLLEDPSVGMVHALGRRGSDARHSKLQAHIVDFAALPPLPPVDEVYLALGTTIKVAGSREAFRAVDFGANLVTAKAALSAGARRAGLLSAMGADARSLIFYNRVKGELEEALGALAFEGFVVARPSLLVGDRVSLGQPGRPLEALSAAAGRVLRPLIPADYRPVRAEDVARALLAHVPHAKGRMTLLSGRLQGGAPER